MLLESIHSPADVRALPDGQLPQLCQELREFLVKSVSQLEARFGLDAASAAAAVREAVGHER